MTFLTTGYWVNVARAISWALVHSLWQGIVMLILAGIVISVTRKTRPAVRYQLLTALMLLFAAGNAATFYLLFQSAMQPDAFVSLPAPAATLPELHNADIAGTKPAFSPNALIDFFDQQSFTITVVWLLVFLFKSIKTALGYQYHRQLLSSAETASEDWQWQLRQLAARLGLFDKVTLLISEKLDTPAAFGFFRQIILLPAGFLTSLPPAQVEAILLHELAHIRRRDYLVNALQCSCENIYFFNPALLWLSARIRRERENCCDDLVIRTTCDERAYINALVAFRELQLHSAHSLTAFTGSENHLLQRIKRILFNNNQPLQAMEKVSITASLLAIAALSFVSFSEKKTFTKPIITVPPVAAVINEPVRTAIRLENPVMKKALPVQKKTNIPAPADTSKFFGAALNEVDAALSNKDFEKARALRWEAVRKLWKEKKALKARETQLRLQTETFARNKQVNETRLPALTLSEDILRIETDQVAKKKAELAAAEAELDASEKNLWQQFNAAQRTEAADNQEKLTEELIAAGIIKSRENLSYKLHNMFFIVNGVELPESVHQQFKTKYLKNTWTEYVYNWDGATGYRFTGVRYNG